MNALEFYSGIGGMHYSMRAAGWQCAVVAAYDINTLANQVYRHNFPNVDVQNRNLCSISAAEMDSIAAHVWLLAPPCQPFTRVGKQLDLGDHRTDSFAHLLVVLRQMKERPRFILLENVKGFETSETRKQFVDALIACEYTVYEFLLNPLQFGIPNSRLRYYAVAARNLDFAGCLLTSSLNFDLPGCNSCDVSKLSIGNFMDVCANGSANNNIFVDDKTLLNYGEALDIVNLDSLQSCCFTKAYTHYAKGTGSVFCGESDTSIANAYLQARTSVTDAEKLSVLRKLKLRYFTPSEVARLLGFPDEFQFPEGITVKQQYRLLGNSISIHVVSRLLMCFKSAATTTSIV